MRHLFLFFALFLLSESLFATHIVGGEMTYRCIGDKKVEVTLTVFRDCYNGVPEFDSLALMVMYDENWNYVDFLPKTHGVDDTLDIILTNPCHVAPPNVCVHRTSYTFEVDLPSDTLSYYIVYQRCCRNRLIRNIEEPMYTGATFLVKITPESIKLCNNSPVYKQWPPVSICVNEPIDFDHSATDVDGDSIVYELCTPFQGLDTIIPNVSAQPGPYEEVVWIDPPYNLSNVLGGVPLSIDPQTGFLTGVPNLIGNFVVGICAKEYRDGVLISVLRRDFQYNVADCGEPASAFQAPIVQCDDRTVFFDNQSQFVKDGYQWYFDVTNDLSLQSTEYEPSHTYPDTGTYTTMLIANPGKPCTDTAIQLVTLADNHLSADFALGFPDCDSVLSVSVQDLSFDSVFAVAEWSWVLASPDGQSLTFDQPDPTFEVASPGLYKLTLVVTSENGCTRTLTKPFQTNFPNLDPLAETVYLCYGDTAVLFPSAAPNFDYEWSPDFAISNINAPNPSVFPLESMGYSVTVTNPINGCSRTGMVQVEVGTSSGTVLTATAFPQKIPEGESSQLEAIFPSANPPTGFSWSPAATLDTATLQNPLATPLDSTLYTVTVTEASGCTSTASVWVYVIKGDICVEPYIFFPTGFSPNGDGENDVLQIEGNFIENVYWVIYDRWGKKIFEANNQADFWDGKVDGKDLSPDTYGYYLRVDCPGGLVTERKGNVTLLR